MARHLDDTPRPACTCGGGEHGHVSLSQHTADCPIIVDAMSRLGVASPDHIYAATKHVHPQFVREHP